MPRTAHAIVLAVLVLATGVWAGGYVAIAVVARTAAATLDPRGRVAFFRSLGRAYLWVGTPALVVALAAGAVLVRDHGWDALLSGAAAVAAALVVLLAAAVAQARRMSVLRRRALETSPADSADSADSAEATEAGDALAARIRRGARTAGIMRAALGLLTVALVVLGAFLAV